MLLDAFGTLLDMEPPGERLHDELLRRGVDVGAEAAAAAFRAEIAFYLDHHMEGRDRASLARLRDRCAEVIARALGIEGVDAGTVRAAMLAAIRFRPYADAAPALRDLRRRGLTLVAASNWDCSLSEVLRDAGLARLLDGVVASATAGAAKPDPAIFRAALDRAQARPEEALHVGDSLHADVGGARASGITPVLLDRRGRYSPQQTNGAAIIRSLAELPPLLDRGPG